MITGRQKQIGFTIVELLIVIVVIAILAAITIVAFNGIQERAKLTVLRNDLSAAARLMEGFKAGATNEQYPTTLEQAGIKPSGGIDLQLTANNAATPKTFCITAVDTKKVGVAYRITQAGTIESGQCAGHTTNPGFTNLIANPGAEQGSGTVTTRTNLFLNPQQLTGGSMGSGLSPVTGLTNFGGFTTGSTGVADGGWKSFYINGVMPYTGTATPIAMRFWAKTNQSGWAPQNLSNNITVTSSWGGVLKRLDTNQTISDLVGDNVARQYSLTFTVPTTQTTAWNFGFKHSSATADPSKEITITGLLAEQAMAPGSYFYGSTADSYGLSYTWNGSTNNSTSSQQGTQVSAYGSNRVMNVQSTAWAGLGNYSLMQEPQSVGTNDNYTELMGSAVQASAMKPSTLYTIMATVRVDDPLTGTLSGNGSRSLFVHLNGTSVPLTGTRQAPNEPGVYDLRATFTTPASLSGYNTIRLYHGGYAGSGQLWWDKIGIVEGDYTGTYFE